MVIAKNVTDEKRNKAWLLSYVGEEPYEVYKHLTTGAKDEPYEYIITLLDGHFAPKSSISYGQYFLQNFNQNYD